MILCKSSMILCKMIIFRSKSKFSQWPSALYPNFLFQDQRFFYATFFKVVSIEIPSIFARNERCMTFFVEQVIQKSDVEWKTEMYWLMKDFKSKTLLPPPFSIFETFFLGGFYVFKIIITKLCPVKQER